MFPSVRPCPAFMETKKYKTSRKMGGVEHGKHQICEKENFSQQNKG